MSNPKAPRVPRAPKIAPKSADPGQDPEVEIAVGRLTGLLSHPESLRVLDLLADIGIGGSCSLRDRFAAHALQSALLMNVMGHARTGQIPDDPFEAAARAAYKIADAMLAWRKIGQAVKS